MDEIVSSGPDYDRRVSRPDPSGAPAGARRTLARPRRIPKLAEVIAAELRSRILSGELKPGESLLSEATLIEKYEVSRPTLREALRLLEAQSLISVRRGSHRGPVVVHPDGDVVARAVAIQLQLRGAALADVYEFRMAYEPAAARMAAERADDDGVARLRAVLTDEVAAVGDDHAFADAAWRFHSALVELSGNTTMGIVTASLQHISAQHAERSMSGSAEHLRWQELSVKAHRQLVDLIEQRAGAEAERFWAGHMAAVAQIQRAATEGQLVRELLD
jgi:GntR family transcriptional repressor for pyruvate dehydrogenase complex